MTDTGEELGSQFGFEVLDRQRKGGLGDEDCLGRGGEPPVVDHCHEVGELPTVHLLSLSIAQKSLCDFWCETVRYQVGDRRARDRGLAPAPRRAPPPAAIRNRKNAYWLAVAAVCIGAFMGQLDASIVTVALPTLQRTFGASVGAVTWVGLSYLLVLVATVTAVGRFADMWGASSSTSTGSPYS